MRVLEVEEGKQIDAKNIATSIDDQNKVLLTNKTSKEEEPEEYKISTNNLSLKPYETKEHNVRIWLDESAGNDTQNKSFKSKVIIEATQNQIAAYKEEILNGADPVLYDTIKKSIAIQTATGVDATSDALIPVTIDDNGTVKRADITTDWYDYETKRWANAVILVDNNKKETINPGDVINEEDIESYFVWIPKYRYKIFNMGKYEVVEEKEYEEKSQEIEIEFGLENTKDDESNPEYKECATPGKAGEDGACHEGYWMTHPAFTAFENSKGFWVGKFETGYNQDTTNLNTINVTESWNKEGAQKDTNEPTKVIIKPNVYSWRSITLENAYNTSFNYQRNLDSHMMKNTEWGAVAYLTQSKYGRCSNGICEEVTINNNSNFITGFAGASVSQNNVASKPKTDIDGTYNYENKASNLASTTNNYTGIYDMAGGLWEIVLGVKTTSTDVNNANLNNINFGSSKLESSDIKNLMYIDLYLANASYNKRILGDATGEMGLIVRKNNHSVFSWYEDYGLLTSNQTPWVIRGGYFGDNTLAGIFAASGVDGSTSNLQCFRIVLTPTNEVA